MDELSFRIYHKLEAIAWSADPLAALFVRPNQVPSHALVPSHAMQGRYQMQLFDMPILTWLALEISNSLLSKMQE